MARTGERSAFVFCDLSKERSMRRGEKSVEMGKMRVGWSSILGQYVVIWSRRHHHKQQ